MLTTENQKRKIPSTQKKYLIVVNGDRPTVKFRMTWRWLLCWFCILYIVWCVVVLERSSLNLLQLTHPISIFTFRWSSLSRIRIRLRIRISKPKPNLLIMIIGTYFPQFFVFTSVSRAGIYREKFALIGIITILASFN